MDIDFSFWLLLATLVAGAIVLLDRFWFAPARRRALARAESARTLSSEEREEILRENAVIDTARSFFPVLAVVLVLRSWLVEPFTIPSGSMLPTLQVGDYILVNRFAYGLRVPVAGHRMIDIGEPARGDIMVFRFPGQPSTSFIKRVVGLPGDTVAYRNGTLLINGVEVPREFHARLPELDGTVSLLYRERLGEHEHWQRREEGSELFGPSWQVTVPPGEYFVMGDNRDKSNDSRAWGFVPDRLVVGKAFYIWMHKKPGLHLPEFGRNGDIYGRDRDLSSGE